MPYAALRPLVLVLTASLPPRVAAGQASPDTVTLRPVVVTATLLPVPLAAVSSAVTVVQGSALRARGIRTVAEVLREVPGVAVSRSGSYGGATSVFVRGGENDFVKVLVDGVPVNEPGGAFDFAHLTTDVIDRIEIVRGPGSVLYGSDAVAGVIQIFTRTGGAWQARVSAGTGSHATVRAGVDAAGRTGIAAWGLGASRETTDGLYAFNNAYRHATAAGRLRLTIDPRTFAVVSLRYRDATAHYPTDGAGVPSDSNQLVRDRGPTAGVELGRNLSDRLALVVHGGWHATDARAEDTPDSPGDTTGFYASQGRTETQRAGGGARLHWRTGAVGTATVGGEVETQRLHYTSLSQSSFGPFADSGSARRRNRAVYGQLVTPLERAVVLTVGARVEGNERFGTATTWRSGASWQLDAATRVRGTAGTGFKEPTFTEQVGGFGTIGKRDLRPERSRSWEVGIERSVAGDRVRVAATWFDQRFRDLIAFTFTPAPPDTANYFNIAGATARGLEAETTVRVGPAVTAAVRYAWVRTRVTAAAFAPGSGTPFAAGEALLRRPAHSGGAVVTAHPSGPVRGSVEVRAVGRREDLDFATFPTTRVSLHPYTLVALSATVDLSGLGWHGLLLRARADNVFGTVYQEVRGFRAPGRTVFVGGEARFPR